MESVGNIKKTEILRIKQVQLTYLDQPAETDVKSKQLSDLADLISKGEYYFRIAIKTVVHYGQREFQGFSLSVFQPQLFFLSTESHN